MNTWNDGNIQIHRSEIKELAREIDEEIKRLREALELIPAELLLENGPPYVLNFSEETLRQISQATQDKGDEH